MNGSTVTSKETVTTVMREVFDVLSGIEEKMALGIFLPDGNVPEMVEPSTTVRILESLVEVKARLTRVSDSLNNLV